jgi:hypothetical protein
MRPEEKSKREARKFLTGNRYVPYWKIAEAQKLHRCVPPLSIMLLSIMIDSDKVGGVSNMQPTLSEDVPYAYHDHEAAARQTAEVSS